MSQLYMLDTNIVSYIVKGNSPATRARNAELGPNDLRCVSAVTEAELQYGLARQPNARRTGSLNSMLASMMVLPWGQAEARVYGQLRARQESIGKTIESMDLMIAAHAIAAGAILVTNDQAFAHIEATLPMVNWATDL